MSAASAARRLGGSVVGIGTAAACLGTAHAAVNAALLRRPPGSESTARHAAPLRVSVLIPARGEELRIEDCLRCVLAQHSAHCEIVAVIVLDDQSSDATSERVASYGSRVRLIRGEGPAPGWLGKPAACARLAEAAEPTSDLLVFLDADVRLLPAAIDSAARMIEDLGLDLISPYPRQLAHGGAERLVQPLLQWSWLTTLPLRWAERSSRPSLGAANGQFLVVRRDAYLRAGGHRAVRSQVLDDLALLRAIKAAGGHGTVVDGTELATCRMYQGGRELADGYTKSLWAAFGSPAGAVAALGLLIVSYVLPAAAMLRGSRVGALGYAAGVLGRAIAARRTGGRAWPDSAAHPFSILALAGLTARSFAMHRAGTAQWRGRSVDIGAEPSR